MSSRQQNLMLETKSCRKQRRNQKTEKSLKSIKCKHKIPESPLKKIA